MTPEALAQGGHQPPTLTPYTDLSSPPEPMTTNAHLIVFGEMLAASAWQDTERTFENIQEIHSTTEGAEMLRLIVRDNLGGAADIIAAALWDNL